MARAEEAEAARFFVGVLASDGRALEAALAAVSRAWGTPDLASGPIPFAFTSYYEKDAGPEIIRAFWGFPGPFRQEDIVGRKLESNRMEAELAALLNLPWPRPVNLDPGYLAPAKLVLASAKDFSHRLYLGRGIYAEVTLGYRNGAFRPFPWTFPDYASGAYDGFFLELRNRLMRERRERRNGFANWGTGSQGSLIPPPPP